MRVLLLWGAWITAGLSAGCTPGSPPARDTVAVRIGGDTALSPPPLATRAPETRDTAIGLRSEYSGRSVEVSITTPDQRTVTDSIGAGPAVLPSERPDTNPELGFCDCPDGQLFATHVPPGTAWLQVRGIDDGEVTLSLEASSHRSNRTGFWRGAHAVLKKGEIRRWRIQVPSSAHPESLTVTPAEGP